MLAAAMPRAQGSSVHQKELSADFRADFLLRVGWSSEQCHTARAFAVERVEVKQNRCHDFGHHSGVNYKRGHDFSF
jgi:hypothetical protein